MFPQPDKRILTTGGTNAYPNTIAYAKNIDLKETGYVKLAAPQCRIYSNEDTADFGLPYAIFSRDSGTYKVLTPGNDTYEFGLSTLNPNIDTTFAGGSDGLRVFRWVSNLWFINSASAVYSYDGTSVSTNYVSRIAAALDFIALFISRNTLVGRDASNVNVLKQYNTSYNNITNLTLPANFAITGAAFSNELMGVTTKQIRNQGNAIFAIWDGSDTSANRIFEVDDPYILDIAPYNGSWVIFTSRGLLLLFNGGGFTELGRLPSYDLEHRIVDFSPTTLIVFGKILSVDGDNIYLNAYSLPQSTPSRKPYNPFYSGGAYCYDPKHGLYHTAAPSYSEYDAETVSFSGNVGTTSSPHFMETGDEVWPDSPSSNELTAGTTYYAIKKTATTFQLAETYQNALSEIPMTITNGSYSLFYVKRYDYGIEVQRQIDCGTLLNGKDLQGYSTSGALPFFVGARVHPNDLTATRITMLTAAVPVMHNRGYFVLGKYESQNLQDMWHGVAIKYRTLKPQDAIIVKAKIKDTSPVIIGDPTLYANSSYSGEGVQWDGSGQYFTTTTDLTGVQEGDEVHVFAGPGAGQSAHITSIAEHDSGWEVTLDEKIRGTVSGRKSCVSIDKFRKLGIITAEDTEGIKRLALDEAGPSMEIKIELRGMPGLAVSQVIPLASSHQQAV